MTTRDMILNIECLLSQTVIGAQLIVGKEILKRKLFLLLAVVITQRGHASLVMNIAEIIQSTFVRMKGLHDIIAALIWCRSSCNRH
jgi:hypothetical protein